jgi:hypothetical protein
VTMVFVTVYAFPAAPPDSQTVVAVVVLVDEFTVSPPDVHEDEDIVSELNHADQSI